MIDAEARGAWRDLERKLRPYVARRVASAAEVDDLIQEIFLKLHQASSTLADEESFGGWVYRIARNAIVDHARTKRRDSPLSDGCEDPSEDDESLTEQLRSDLGECVALFVSRLSSPYREAITLTELQSLTQREAAEVLGISLPALKAQVLRGRAKIRDMFDDCCLVSVDSRGRVVECEARELSEVPADCRATAAAWAGRPRSTKPC